MSFLLHSILWSGVSLSVSGCFWKSNEWLLEEKRRQKEGSALESLFKCLFPFCKPYGHTWTSLPEKMITAALMQTCNHQRLIHATIRSWRSGRMISRVSHQSVERQNERRQQKNETLYPKEKKHSSWSSIYEYVMLLAFILSHEK